MRRRGISSERRCSSCSSFPRNILTQFDPFSPDTCTYHFTNIHLLGHVPHDNVIFLWWMSCAVWRCHQPSTCDQWCSTKVLEVKPQGCLPRPFAGRCHIVPTYNVGQTSAQRWGNYGTEQQQELHGERVQEACHGNNHPQTLYRGDTCQDILSGQCCINFAYQLWLWRTRYDLLKIVQHGWYGKVTIAMNHWMHEYVLIFISMNCFANGLPLLYLFFVSSWKFKHHCAGLPGVQFFHSTAILDHLDHCKLFLWFSDVGSYLKHCNQAWVEWNWIGYVNPTCSVCRSYRWACSHWLSLW